MKIRGSHLICNFALLFSTKHASILCRQPDFLKNLNSPPRKELRPPPSKISTDFRTNHASPSKYRRALPGAKPKRAALIKTVWKMNDETNNAKQTQFSKTPNEKKRTQSAVAPEFVLRLLSFRLSSPHATFTHPPICFLCKTNPICTSGTKRHKTRATNHAKRTKFARADHESPVSRIKNRNEERSQC